MYNRQLETILAHVGRRDADLGGQFGVNLAVCGAVLLPPLLANVDQHTIARGGPRQGDAADPLLQAGADASPHKSRAELSLTG